MDNDKPDSDLINEARGLAYDTATVLSDVARRMPRHAYRIFVLVDQLRKMANDLVYLRVESHEAHDSTAQGEGDKLI